MIRQANIDTELLNSLPVELPPFLRTLSSAIEMITVSVLGRIDR